MPAAVRGNEATKIRQGEFLTSRKSQPREKKQKCNQSTVITAPMNNVPQDLRESTK